MAFEAKVQKPSLQGEFVEALADEDPFFGLVVAGGFPDDFCDFGHDFLLLHPVLKQNLIDFSLG